MPAPVPWVRSLPVGPAGVAMKATCPPRTHPFAPYHWLMYSKSMWFDIEHVTEELGWEPHYSTDEMLAESYDWFVANRADTDRDDASHHRRTARGGVLSTWSSDFDAALPARGSGR